jgi:SnoaL-like protein
VDHIAHEVVAAIERRDWDGLKPLLHPYLHWTDGAGHTIRGRTKVLANLAADNPARPPLSFTLRDGQIYRWTEEPSAE